MGVSEGGYGNGEGQRRENMEMGRRRRMKRGGGERRRR